MTTDLLTVALVVAVIAAAWYVLGRVEARLTQTGARHPAQDDGPRLLPVWYEDGATVDAEFLRELDRLGVREHLLDVAREVDAGEAMPDAVLEMPRRGGAR